MIHLGRKITCLFGCGEAFIHQVKWTSTFLAFLFLFLFSFLFHFSFSFDCPLVFLLLQGLQLYFLDSLLYCILNLPLKFNGVNVCLKDQNVFRLVIGNVIFFRIFFFKYQLSKSFINTSMSSSKSLSTLSSNAKKFHFQCFDRFSRTFFSCYLNPFVIIAVAESCEQMKTCFYVWFLFITSWCIAHFDPKFLYILQHLTLLCIFHIFQCISIY